jgi:hypothetical protein
MAQAQLMSHRADAGPAIKNAKSADDILAGIGRFTVVEGKGLVRATDWAMSYLNFRPSWAPGVYCDYFKARMIGLCIEPE